MPLNDMLCRNAKPQNKSYRLTDSEGLFLLVLPNGTRTWRIKYYLHGKDRTIALGRYPTISLAKAREEREKIKTDIHNGIDPAFSRAEAKRMAKYKANQTLELVVREWHRNNYDTWCVSHADAILRRFEYHVFPEIGDIPVSSLTPSLILLCLQKVEKTSRDTTHRLLSHLSKIFHYAGATGRIDRDLTFGLSGILKKYKRGHYAAIEIEELPELLAAIHSNKARLYTQTFLALRLIMLTAVRTIELIGARWVEIDFDRKVWTVPAERMKMRKQHFVPLSRQAIEILQTLKEMNGHREFVFPSIPRPRKPMSNATILRALERSGYAKIMTGHGFRSLFIGIAKQELGYRHEVPDRQLAHLPTNSIDRAYDRAQFIEQRITLMQDIADYYDRTLTQHLQQKEKHDRSAHHQPKEINNGNNQSSPPKQGRNHDHVPPIFNKGNVYYIGQKPRNILPEIERGGLSTPS